MDRSYLHPVRPSHRDRVLHERVRLLPPSPHSPTHPVYRLLGNPKEKESLTGLLLNTRVVQLKLGRIDVRFQKPFSLKGYIEEQKVRRDEKLGDGERTPAMKKKEQAQLLRALGYQVLSDINKVSLEILDRGR